MDTESELVTARGDAEVGPEQAAEPQRSRRVGVVAGRWGAVRDPVIQEGGARVTPY